MKSWLRLLVACVFLALPLGWSGCSTSGGEGSETHFVKCEKDSDCIAARAGDLCVDRRCTTAPEGTGGAAPADGGGGTPSTGGGDSTGGTRSTGGGESTGGAAPVPDACDVPSSGTPMPVDYSVSFHFENRSNAPVAILEECFRHFEIFGCTDGYAAALPYSVNHAGLSADSCKRECPDSTCGCIGTCQLKLTSVSSAGPVEDSWDGSLREKDTTFSSCGCVNTGAASPGRYRVRVPVYPAGGDYRNGPSYHVDVDFVLGDQAEVSVTVPLDRAPPPSGCNGLDAASCSSTARCLPARGRSAEAPDDLVFAGCRTNLDDDGNVILTSTVITCARSAAGEGCYLFADSAVPDGWEKLDCGELPADCGVDGTVHPARPF